MDEIYWNTDSRRRSIRRTAADAFRPVLAYLGSLLISGILWTSAANGADGNRPYEVGTVRVPSFMLPESGLLNKGTRLELRRMHASHIESESLYKGCVDVERAPPAQAPTIRECEARAYYKTNEYRSLRERYDVSVTIPKNAGARSEIFTPETGIALRIRSGLLVSLRRPPSNSCCPGRRCARRHA